MRKVICFILAMACVLSMSCVAFADGTDVSSPGSSDVCKEHNYENGVCTICGAECVHDYEDGVCTICGDKKDSGNTGSGSGSTPMDPNANPKTGDTIVFFVVVMLAAVAALVAVVMQFRKKKNC